MSYGSRKRSYDQGGCVRGRVWPPSPEYNVEPVTNTSSSSCANNGDERRRECSARLRPLRLYFSHFATRTVYNTVDLYAVYAAIFVQNRVFAYPTCVRRPRKGGFRRNIATPFSTEKLEWLGYLTVEKIRRYLYSFWRNSRTWQTDTQTPHDGIGRAYASHRAAKIDCSRRHQTLYISLAAVWRHYDVMKQHSRR